MKLRSGWMIGLVGLVGLTAARGQEEDQVQPVAAIDGKPVCSIRAFVNGEPIFDDEIRDVIIRDLFETRGLPESEQAKARVEIWRKGLDKLVEREVIYTEAHGRLASRPHIWSKLTEAADKEFGRRLRFRMEQAGVVSEDEFKAMMASQGMSLDKLRRGEERQFIANEFMRSMIFSQIQKISHLDLLQYYEEHPADFQAEDKVRWQDIFIDAGKHPTRFAARQLAEDIARRAQAGEDFETLVKQYDDGDSSFRQGEGYGQHKGEIKPVECEAVLFQLQDGQLGPIIEIPTGFHVVRLVERQYAGKVPFDAKTQAAIRRKLQSAIAEREYLRLVNELKRKATIQIIEGDS